MISAKWGEDFTVETSLGKMFDEGRKAGLEAGRIEGHRKGLREATKKLEQVKQEAYERGYDAGRQDAFTDMDDDW